MPPAAPMKSEGARKSTKPPRTAKSSRKVVRRESLQAENVRVRPCERHERKRRKGTTHLPTLPQVSLVPTMFFDALAISVMRSLSMSMPAAAPG